MYHAFSSFLLSTAVQYIMIPREEVELDDVTSYNIWYQNIHDIIIKLTYSHPNSKIKKQTLIDVARYKSLIEQCYSCTIRYFDRPDSFCGLVTWPTKISDDTLAFLFNKCNILLTWRSRTMNQYHGYLGRSLVYSALHLFYVSLYILRHCTNIVFISSQ